MNKNILSLIFFALIVSSCSSGKKALQKGDYFNAVSQAIERLKSDPDNNKATQVLKEGYPMAIEWSQEEMDFALSSNSEFKWEKAINLMKQVNRLSDLIRSTPAARNIIETPKSYSSELNMAYEKAAEARYIAGEQELNQNTQESARKAFDHYYVADQLVPCYKDVSLKLDTSKELATLKVIVEAITVHTQKYKLSSEFFYNQVFEYLNNQYPKRGFVNFYSPQQAENFKIEQPDFVWGLISSLYTANLAAVLVNLALIPIFVWVIEKRFILKEERYLRSKFGVSFYRYTEKTRRWV